MAMHDVQRAREETAFSPFNFILARAFTENRVAIAAQTDEDLFEEILSRRQRFARRYFENHSVHVHVAGKVEIHAAAFDLGPGLYFVRHHIKDHMLIVIPRDLCVFDPVAIKVAFDAPAAADVRRAVNRILLLDTGGLRFRLRFFRALRIRTFHQSASNDWQCEACR